MGESEYNRAIYKIQAFVKKKFIFLLSKTLATGLGSGLAPKAPGTFGSLACLALWYFFSLGGLLHSLNIQIIVALVVSIIGILASALFVKSLSEDDKDPQMIVIDEWAGLLISLIGCVELYPFAAIVAFTLFRAFDILKPGPVGWAEDLPGAWGIMMDDIVAGFLALLIMQLAVIPIFFY